MTNEAAINTARFALDADADWNVSQNNFFAELMNSGVPYLTACVMQVERREGEIHRRVDVAKRST